MINEVIRENELAALVEVQNRNIELRIDPENPPILGNLLINTEALKQLFEVASRNRSHQVEKVTIQGIESKGSVQATVEHFFLELEQNKLGVPFGEYDTKTKTIFLNVDVIIIGAVFEQLKNQQALGIEDRALDTLAEEVEHSFQNWSWFNKLIDNQRGIQLPLSYIAVLVCAFALKLNVGAIEGEFFGFDRFNALKIAMQLNFLGLIASTGNFFLKRGILPKVLSRFAFLEYMSSKYESEAKVNKNDTVDQVKKEMVKQQSKILNLSLKSGIDLDELKNEVAKHL